MHYPFSQGIRRFTHGGGYIIRSGIVQFVLHITESFHIIMPYFFLINTKMDHENYDDPLLFQDFRRAADLEKMARLGGGGGGNSYNVWTRDESPSFVVRGKRGEDNIFS